MLILSTILFAIAFSAGLVAVYQLVIRDRDPVVARLRDLRSRALSARPEQLAPHPPLVATLLAMLGGLLPTGESQDAVRSGLERAGIRNPGAAVVFLGTKVLLAAVCGVPRLQQRKECVRARSDRAAGNGGVRP